MSYYLNIEKSAFHKGRYVGYADGVWYIERNGRQWIARHRESSHQPVMARTLSEMSGKLATIVDALASDAQATSVLTRALQRRDA